MVDDYLKRFDRIGRPLGLGPAEVREVEDKKGIGMVAEVDLLSRVIPDGSFTVVLSERGKPMTSEAFADTLSRTAMDGTRDMAFVIGGADGLPREFEANANLTLSFGKMVWPHMLVRVMLAEQIYRAANILAGTPYHRA